MTKNNLTRFTLYFIASALSFLALIFTISSASAQVRFDPDVHISGSSVTFSWSSDWPVDFLPLSGSTCPDEWDTPSYLTQWGQFSYTMNKPGDPGEHECIVTAIEYPLFSTGQTIQRYKWSVLPTFTAIFDEAQETYENGKNFRLIMRTSRPIAPNVWVSKLDQLIIQDSNGYHIGYPANNTPIVNITYFGGNDPRVIYDLKFPQIGDPNDPNIYALTGTMTISPDYSQLQSQGESLAWQAPPSISFILTDPIDTLTASWSTGSITPTTPSPLNEYLDNSSTIDPTITNASPLTLSSVLLDIRSMLIILVFILLTWLITRWFISLLK